MLKNLEKRLAEKQISLIVSDAACDFIIESAYDPMFGARPLKRFLQSKLETLIARKIIAEDIAPQTTLHVEVGDDGLYIV